MSNLDPYWVMTILGILRDAVTQGSSAIVALHDLDRMTSFDRVLLVTGGRIAADMPPERMMASSDLVEAFGVERQSGEWRLSSREDRRSSP